jgi:parallel beta-helix repeat protein
MVQFKQALLCSIILCLSIVPLTQTCFAQEQGFIYIRADGSIDPPTAPISTVDNVTYTLADDLFNDSIMIERDNIVVDGAFHVLEGASAQNGFGIRILERTNVTIKNMTIKTFAQAIWVGPYSSYIMIFGNNITDIQGLGYAIYIVNSPNNTICGNNMNSAGIGLYNSAGNSIFDNNIIGNGAWGISIGYYSSNNTIYGNNLTNNFSGIAIDSSSTNNMIYHNNFMNNYTQVDVSGATAFWDNGSEGNYWSDYNGTDNNQDGIGDTPYLIDANNVDHYPLMAQYVIPEFPSFIIPPMFIIAALLAIVIYKRKHLT